MNLSFWKQIQENWQCVQYDSAEDVINLELFLNIVKNDVSSIKEKKSPYEVTLELSNEDDFWGGI